MESKKNSKKIYLFYTVCFFILYIGVFYQYIISKTSNINIAFDGLTQHFVALKYYGEFLKNIINNLIKNHKLIIPQFDISFGEGNDILNTLSYYVMGDPFALLSVFFNMDNYIFCYDFLNVLRLFLAGFTFVYLCKYLKCKSDIFILIGSSIYVFNYWCIGQCALGHPYFLNVFIYLPLLIVSVNKILDNKSPYLYILIVAISSASNLYFFYMIAISIFVYVIIKLIINENNQNRKIKFLQFAIYTIIGLLISSLIIIPNIYFILSDTRTSGFSIPFNVFNSFKKNIINFLSLFFYNEWDGNDMHFAFPFTILIITTLSFISEKKKYLKYIFVFLILMIFFLPFWKFINCLSYCSQRWEFLIIFIISFFVAKFDLKIETIKKTREILILGILFFVINICFYKKINIALYIDFLIFIISVCIVFIKNINIKFSKLILLTLTIFSLIYHYNDVCIKENWLDGYVKYNDKNMYEEKSVYRKIKELSIENGEKDFFRVSGPNLDWDRNSNSLLNISSSQYYWTFTNPYINNYRRRIGFIDMQPWTQTDYSGISLQNDLSCVKYYTDNSLYEQIERKLPIKLPYGYNKDAAVFKDGVAIYKNDKTLPIVYFYKNTISTEEVKNLDLASLQYNMLINGISDEKTEIAATTAKNLDYEIRVPAVCKDFIDMKITDDKKIIISAREKGYLEIEFEGDKNSEFYLELKGFKCYKYNLDKMIKVNDNNNTFTFFDNYNTKNHFQYFSDYDSRGRVYNFTFNMGYMENREKVEKAYFYIDQPGIYTIDDLILSKFNFDNYDELIDNLKSIELLEYDSKTNRFDFKINSKNSGIMVIAIPYGKGFKIKINGVDKKIKNINYKYMGVDVDKGESLVELIYERPYQKVGNILSAIGIFLLILTVTNYKRIFRKKQFI